MGFYEWLLIIAMSAGILVYLSRPAPQRKQSWAIGVFFGVSLFLEVLADYQMLVLRRENMPVYHLAVISQFFLLTVYFYQSLRSRSIIYLAIIAVVLEAYFISSGIQSMAVSPSYIRLFCRLSLLTYILIFFYRIVRQEDMTIQIEAYQEFWVSCGILFLVANFTMIGLMNYIIARDRMLALTYYEFSLWFDVAFYLLLSNSLFYPLRFWHESK